MNPGRAWRLVSSPVAIRLWSVAVGFVSSVLINRSLGVDLRGGYTTITVYASLIQAVGNLGLTFAYAPLMRAFGEERAKAGLLTLVWGQFAAYLVLLPCALPFFSDESDFAPVSLLSIAQILENQIVFIALIENIRRRNRTLLQSSILYACANLAILLFFPHNLVAIVGCLIGKALFEVVACSLQERLFVFAPKSLDMHFVAKALRFGLPTALLALLIQCNYNIDVVAMNYFGTGDYELGLFGTAYSLSNMLWFIPDAFKELVYHDSVRKNIDARTICLILINMAICVIICIAFGIFGEAFLGVLFGNAYCAAYPVTLVAFAGIIPMVAFKLIHPIYVNNGKSMRVVSLLVVSVLANIAIAVVLIPRYGAIGAAASTVFSYTICGMMFFVMYIKETGVTAIEVRSEFDAMKARILK